MDAAWTDVSDTFAEETLGTTHLLLRKEYAESLHQAAIHDPAACVERAGDDVRSLRGRGRVVSLPLPGRPGERMVIRRYLHGGLSAPLFGGFFAGPSRALREVRIAHLAESRGVATYTPLASVTQRVGLAFYQAYLVSLEIPDAVDLLEYFRSAPPWPPRRRVLAAAGRAVRAMHDQGLHHGDLHLKNLLVTDPAGPEPRVHILDWDKSTVSPALTERQRFSNLARLDRSGAKLARQGVAVTGRDRLAFLRAYQPGEALFAPRDFQRMERTWAIHGLGWRMGDLLR